MSELSIGTLLKVIIEAADGVGNCTLLEVSKPDTGAITFEFTDQTGKTVSCKLLWEDNALWLSPERMSILPEKIVAYLSTAFPNAAMIQLALAGKLKSRYWDHVSRGDLMFTAELALSR